MTSDERHEARYQRRVAARIAKKSEACKEYDDYSTVFTYGNLYDSYKQCRKGVGWKASTQKYRANAAMNVYKTYAELKNGSFKSDGFFGFDIFERGKLRHIRSVSLRERVVQRCLCDYSLVPLMARMFIYDNGASMKHKGYDFSQRRCIRHLQYHYRKHGTEGYVLVFDFSKFFDNVSHAEIERKLRKAYTDERLHELCRYFVGAFGDTGLGLGSQISQVLALASADRLDHFIKEELRVKCYGRYMDDGYLIHKDKAYLQYCLARIREKCVELGIKLNEKKTHIIKLTHGFTFLKVRMFLTQTGKIVKKVYKTSVTRMRRKLKKFRAKVDAGIMTAKDVYQSFQSWRSHVARLNSYHVIANMERLYEELYAFSRKEECYVL